MPIFQDPDITPPALNEQRPSFGPGEDEQLGPQQQAADKIVEMENVDERQRQGEALSTSPTKAVLAAIDDTSLSISNRVELIERIKRGESPTWLPNGTLEGYYRELSNPPAKPPDVNDGSTEAPHEAPAAEPRTPTQTSPPEQKLHAASDIERPRSALHSGDFTQEAPSGQGHHQTELPADSNSQQALPQSQGLSSGTSWPARSPERSFDQWRSYVNRHETSLDRRTVHPLAASPPSSGVFPSNFVLSTPTSPLAQTFSQADAEPLPGCDQGQVPAGRSYGSRRHTLPPHSLQSFQSSPPGQLPRSQHMEHFPLPRRSNKLPYQGHYARRSLTSDVPSSIHGSRVPSMPARMRRPSLSSESPSLHHASMVGSYEESILRGRMSTAPSKPFDFVAQIGVLGLGNCKPQLRCPAHVLVPFPAVFYSYSKTNVERSPPEEGPSPYVGLIDLEHSLAKPEGIDGEDRRRRRRTPVSGNCSSYEGQDDGSCTQTTLSNHERRLRRKKKRRSSSPKTPPGGSYRIPQKGQLQIVIKNPNKTAVKLFLVPYDLEGMEPGTKTFIRQRSYSTGPILELPLRSTTNAETVDVAKERPTLRYLIHLHICCPSRGRFFLYKSIRVVFANRVTDGKEHLRNEIQFPEPRYSIYKPGRESTQGGTPSSTHTRPRRRSSEFRLGFGWPAEAYDAVDGIGQFTSYPVAPPSPFTRTDNQPGQSPTTLSFTPSENLRVQSDSSNLGEHGPIFDQASTNVLRASPGRQTQGHLFPDHLGFQYLAESAPDHREPNGTGSTIANGEQLEFGNGILGQPLPAAAESREGLLAKRLRGLDVQRHPDQGGFR